MKTSLVWSNFDWASYKKWAKVTIPFPGKVVCHRSQFYTVITEKGFHVAEVTGKLKYDAEYKGDLPAVGDWVSLDKLATNQTVKINKVLPRKTYLSRKVIGDLTDSQLLAANCDIVFVVASLDDEFNVNRIERYITSIREGGAEPLVILNKVDICPTVDEKCKALERTGIKSPILLSVKYKKGLEQLATYLLPKKTVAIVGSSGVGKSSLINELLGRAKTKTGLVRAFDGKGMHTTIHREIFCLDSGALLIDMPGIKEVQLWSEGKGLKKSFDDIETLSKTCKFSNCQHEAEPGCAVKKALDAGELSSPRFANFLKQRVEVKKLKTKKLEKTWLKKGQARKSLYFKLDTES